MHWYFTWHFGGKNIPIWPKTIDGNQVQNVYLLRTFSQPLKNRSKKFKNSRPSPTKINYITPLPACTLHVRTGIHTIRLNYLSNYLSLYAGSLHVYLTGLSLNYSLTHLWPESSICPMLMKFWRVDLWPQKISSKNTQELRYRYGTNIPSKPNKPFYQNFLRKLSYILMESIQENCEISF